MGPIVQGEISVFTHVYTKSYTENTQYLTYLQQSHTHRHQRHDTEHSQTLDFHSELTGTVFIWNEMSFLWLDFTHSLQRRTPVCMSLKTSTLKCIGHYYIHLVLTYSLSLLGPFIFSFSFIFNSKIYRISLKIGENIEFKEIYFL